MKTSQRRSRRDPEGRFADNREQRNYGSQKDYNNDYDEYNPYEYEDKDGDRPFGRTANYSDYERNNHENDYDDDFEPGFGHHEYASGEERGRSQGRTGYRDGYGPGHGYQSMSRNGRNIEGENGGYSDSYSNSDYTSHRDLNGNGYNFNFGSYGNRTDSRRNDNAPGNSRYQNDSARYGSGTNSSRGRSYGQPTSSRDGYSSSREYNNRGNNDYSRYTGSSRENENSTGHGDENASRSRRRSDLQSGYSRNDGNTYQNGQASNGARGIGLNEDGSRRRRRYTY